MKALQKFAPVHANVQNHFNLERHPVDRQTFQERRSAAPAEWQASSPKTARSKLGLPANRRRVEVRLAAPSSRCQGPVRGLMLEARKHDPAGRDL